MSDHLTPVRAAELAMAVYGIQYNQNVVMGFAGEGMGHLNTEYDTGNATVVSGSSGAGMLKPETGFGVIMKSNKNPNEVVVTTRGTASLADWLSNANTGFERGPGGYLVHSGFHRIYKGFKSEMLSTVRSMRPGLIHCVGHSLGGALANQVAFDLKQSVGCDIKLYTYGAPRVGMSGFSSALTSALSASNVHRVFHPADPVPWVPIFPFQHVTEGIALPNTGLDFNPFKHKMGSSYKPAVEGLSWGSIAGSHDRTTGNVEKALEFASEVATFPGTGLWAITKALGYIWELARPIVGISITVGVTMIDYVAMMLARAAEISKEIGWYLGKLIEIVMRFIGKAAAGAYEVTKAVLSYILQMLFQGLAIVARKALRGPFT
ncbi:MAG: lipase family protein [Pseudomonadota bacterium]